MEFDWDEGEGDRSKAAFYSALVVVVGVLVVGAYLLGAGQLQIPSAPSGDTGEENFTEYASANEKTGTTNVGDAKIVKTIKISEFGVTPARVSIETGQAVRWVNRNPFSVRLKFDRTPQEPVIGPGEELEMRFRAVTYYQVFNVKTGERIARGSISVG